MMTPITAQQLMQKHTAYIENKVDKVNAWIDANVPNIIQKEYRGTINFVEMNGLKPCSSEISLPAEHMQYYNLILDKIRTELETLFVGSKVTFKIVGGSSYVDICRVTISW